MPSKIKVLFFTNIPSPYRITLFNELTLRNNIEVKVLYCAVTEDNRNWNNLTMEHDYSILKQHFLGKLFKLKYLNKNIFASILKFKPDVIVTGGFYPTMLFAILFSRLLKIKHFINTDAWEINEKKYHKLLILLRKIIYKSTDGFLPVGKKGYTNFLHNYKIKKEKIFIVPYAVDGKIYTPDFTIEKKYDLIFVAQFIERKLPFFIVNIIRELVKIRPNLTIVIIGNGPLKDQFLREIQDTNVVFEYPGYIQPHQIADFYKQSKLLLFPTELDGWGVVANEAISLGVPCITNENAGCAGELVLNNFTGFVLDLKPNIWVNTINTFLDDLSLQNEMTHNCISHSKNFSPTIASENFETAVNKQFVNE